LGGLCPAAAAVVMEGDHARLPEDDLCLARVDYLQAGVTGRGALDLVRPKEPGRPDKVGDIAVGWARHWTAKAVEWVNLGMRMLSDGHAGGGVALGGWAILRLRDSGGWVILAE